MQRKKILISIDWFLPGTKSGGPVRSYANMIDYLGRYHDFYIVTRNTDYCSEEVYAHIKSNEWNQINDHAFVYYFSKGQLNKSNLKQVLKFKNFDFIYINGIYSFYFSILPLFILNNKKNIIVAARGMLNPQAFSVKKGRKKLFLNLANLLGLYKNVKFHATNEDEANHIKSIVGKQTKVHIAPNLPRPSTADEILDKEKSHPTRFVNIARISTEKGTLKMIDSLNSVKTDMILDLFGPIYDETYWQACQRSMNALPNNVKVFYKGILSSEDVPMVLQQYDFFVLLSEGENFGHAILEAFTAGCPVIISDKTPWKDLKDKMVGWDVDCSDPSIPAAIFEEACQLSREDYAVLSKKAKQFSKDFSENPELLALNLALFN